MLGIAAAPDAGESVVTAATAAAITAEAAAEDAHGVAGESAAKA